MSKPSPRDPNQNLGRSHDLAPSQSPAQLPAQNPAPDPASCRSSSGLWGTLRIWLVGLLCMVFFVGAVMVQRNMMFRGIRDLGVDMTDFPDTVGPWTRINRVDHTVATVVPYEEDAEEKGKTEKTERGKDGNVGKPLETGTDPSADAAQREKAKLLAAQNARNLARVNYLAPISLADRCYQNDQQVTIFTHMIWTKDYFRIHLPEKCYGGNGFSLKKTEDLTFKGPQGHVFPVRMLTFSNTQETRFVAYWFQYNRGPEAQFAFGELPTRWARIRCCFGQDQWPPLVKVMFDVRVPSQADESLMAATARDAIESMTQEVQRFLWNGTDTPAR